MSTDPKKLVKTILLTYFLAMMFFISGYTCKDVHVLSISFTFISELLVVSSILALKQNYKKYRVSMYKFLEIIGIIFALFEILTLIVSLL